MKNMEENKNGCIYILTNPSFPDYIKIGYADDIEKRLNQLNRSESIPFAFRVYATYEVQSRLTDKELHKLIDALNPDLRAIESFDGKERVKEFYAMSAEDGYQLLECIAKISGTIDKLHRMTPEGHEILDEELADEIKQMNKSSRKKKGPFNFSKYGIQPGEELNFIDDETIKVKVVNDRKIEYNGEITSLSELAQRLKKANHPLQGTLYFTYKDEKLTDIRERLDN